MLLTRSQTENCIREELIEELLKVSDIINQAKKLADRFNTFAEKHVELK